MKAETATGSANAQEISRELAANPYGYAALLLVQRGGQANHAGTKDKDRCKGNQGHTDQLSIESLTIG